MKKPSRILLATFGTYGDLNPFLALGLALKARGHDATIATSPTYRDDVLRVGLGFAPARPEIDRTNLERFERAMDRVRGSEFVVREIMMPAVKDSYADLERAAVGADLLITHSLAYAASVLAEKKNLRWLSVALQPLVFFSRYDPPVFAPAPWLAALRPLGPAVNGALLSLLMKVSYPWGEPVRALRRELGLPPGEDPIFAGQHSPQGVLALFSPLVGRPQADWPENVRVCGFPFHDADIGGKDMDPRLDAFLSAGPPPVAFTLGSAAVLIASEFYRVAKEAARRVGARAVLLAGPAADSLGPLPEGVAAFPTAPYHSLFPRCAAVVHSGGVGTTAQALRAGIRQLIVPHAHDQFDNAARVSRLRTGAWIHPDGLTPARLTRALSHLLGDHDGRARAEAVGAAIRKEDGIGAACAEIERVLQN